MNYLKMRNKYIPNKVVNIRVNIIIIKTKIKNNANMINEFRIEPLVRAYYELFAQCIIAA